MEPLACFHRKVNLTPKAAKSLNFTQNNLWPTTRRKGEEQDQTKTKQDEEKTDIVFYQAKHLFH
jgi:hypothetical protein